MLTPNESSEDEDIFESKTASNSNMVTKTTNISNTSKVDKRKIAEAVQSLIDRRPNIVPTAVSGTSTNIKFKFRMKFKATQAATNMKKAVNKALNDPDVTATS